MKIIFYLGLIFTLLPFKAKANFYNQEFSGTQAYIFWTGHEECFDCEPTLELAFSTIKENFPEFNVSVLDYNQSGNHNYVFEFNLIDPLCIILVEIANGINIKQNKIILSPNDINYPYFKENLISEIDNFLN